MKTVHRILWWGLLFMALGTVMELLLLGHFENAWQFLPIICLVAIGIWLIFFRQHTSGLVYGLLLICGGTGFTGLLLHFKGNIEFEKEIHPTSDHWTHTLDALSGATPTLAPASMIAIALFSWVYVLLQKHKQIRKKEI